MLKEEIKALGGKRRRFLLLRIADVETNLARNLCGITVGTYNTWLQSPEFVSLYRRRGELAAEYKQEAIQLMRRENQLAAILLEEKIIQKMKEEIESGVYELIKTNLAREVYSKLIADLDIVPKVHVLSWEQRVQSLLGSQQERITEGEVIEGEFTETVGIQENKHQES